MVRSNHRKLTDERFRQVSAECPDGDGVLVPTGDAYALDFEASKPRAWMIAFCCPNHPDEIIRIWRPEFQPLIDEVLEGVDVSSLPLVGPGLREL